MEEVDSRIDVVKSYAKHEKETMFQQKNYPELKSSENYSTLQKSIANSKI